MFTNKKWKSLDMLHLMQKDKNNNFRYFWGGLEQPIKCNCSAPLAAEVKHSWNIIKHITKFLKHITLIMFHLPINQLGMGSSKRCGAFSLYSKALLQYLLLQNLTPGYLWLFYLYN